MRKIQSIPVTFGATLDEARRFSGLTQSQLARQCGLKRPAQINRYISGEQVPPRDRFEAILRAVHPAFHRELCDLFSRHAVPEATLKLFPDQSEEILGYVEGLILAGGTLHALTEARMFRAETLDANLQSKLDDIIWGLELRAGDYAESLQWARALRVHLHGPVKAPVLTALTLFAEGQSYSLAANAARTALDAIDSQKGPATPRLSDTYEAQLRVIVAQLSARRALDGGPAKHSSESASHLAAVRTSCAWSKDGLAELLAGETECHLKAGDVDLAEQSFRLFTKCCDDAYSWNQERKAILQARIWIDNGDLQTALRLLRDTADFCKRNESWHHARSVSKHRCRILAMEMAA